MARMQGFNNRKSSKDGPEDYPTQPWATRALLTHVIPGDYSRSVVWEPAANRGYMARPLTEFFGQVIATDKFDYGLGLYQVDFLEGPTPADQGLSVDWIITNPPFNLAEAFIIRALGIARAGVAMFVRTSFLEGLERLDKLFKIYPPTLVAPFAERVPLVQGRVDPKAATQMPYCWMVWQRGVDTADGSRLVWIPGCRRQLERPGDYAQFGTPPEAAEGGPK